MSLVSVPFATTAVQPQSVGGVSIQSGSGVEIQWPGISALCAGAATLTNQAKSPRLLSVSSVDRRAAAGVQAAATQWNQSTTLILPPGQSAQIPAPPTGQVWQVVVMSQREINKWAMVGTAAIVGVAGLASYGAWELLSRLWHEVSRRRDRFGTPPRSRRRY